MQNVVIKFVSDLRQVGGFLPVSSTNKTDRHDITAILLKVALNTITPSSSKLLLTFNLITMIDLKIYQKIQLFTFELKKTTDLPQVTDILYHIMLY
jgi:hypothetical protein